MPLSDTKKVSEAHACSTNAVLDALEVIPSQGLTTEEVAERLAVFGPNKLAETRRVNVFVLFFRQLRSPIVLLLLAACIYSLAISEYAEFLAILAVLVINTTIGFVTEYRALRSMQALKDLTRVTVRARRDGELVEVNAESLVPGDILVLDAGDILAADARVILSSSLACDESALTGESVPASKSIDAIDGQAVVADRINMVFKGCGVTRGTGEAVVTGTGMDTELGKIANLVESAEAEHSPLERQLARLSQNLVWVTLGLTGVLALVGIGSGRDLTLMLESSVALAVAAIPEGLPIVATLALARGMLKMARHNALIEKLSSVETLGATTVILTDKTGTLTENHMRVSSVHVDGRNYHFSPENDEFSIDGQAMDPAQDASLMCLLRSAALCNNANFHADTDSGVGDPMEVALLEVAEAASIDRNELIKQMPEVGEHAFDSATRRMATVHAEGGHYVIAVKGAPGAILDLVSRMKTSRNGKRASGEDIVEMNAARRKAWNQLCDDMAEQGLRLLAIGGKRVDSRDADPYSDLVLYGVIALYDPPRADVAEAIGEARRAGIRVVMVTGDHQATARYIADSVGLTDHDSLSMNGSEISQSEEPSAEEAERLRKVDLFSRVNPEQKLKLISLHQKDGAVVAMTGDGVNDAPALKKADIGIAMGVRGTQVAKEASAMILKDDAFPTIVHAIREGRVIYSNIRRFTVYLLSCNFSEILVVSVAVTAALPLPLLPLQILFLNLVTDVFPAFALGTIEPGRDLLSRAPREPGEPILGRSQWSTIVIHGVVLSCTTLLALLTSIHVLELEGDAVTTVSFLTLALSQLWHMFGMHNWREGWFRTAIVRNRFVWLATVVCLVLLAIGMTVPSLASVLRLVPLEWSGWALAVGASFIPWLLREMTATWCRFRQAD